jgi:hypothetical protein
VIQQERCLLAIAKHFGERKPRFFGHAAASASWPSISMSSVLSKP